MQINKLAYFSNANGKENSFDDIEYDDSVHNKLIYTQFQYNNQNQISGTLNGIVGYRK